MTTERDQLIANALDANVADVLENGPRLNYTKTTFTIARDRVKKQMLIGGLGAMGVGEMWFNDDGSHVDDPTYPDAPEQEAPPPFTFSWDK